MALRFFYRRQKMVFIIMVVLMVSFLIGFQGFSMIFSGRGGRYEIGHTKWGKIRQQDFVAAGEDLNVIRRLPTDRGTPDQFLASVALRVFPGDDQAKASMSYALLLAEAEGAGVQVSSAEVDQFLEASGIKPEDEQVRRQVQGVARRWLTILKNAWVGTDGGAPCERELEHLYRDLHENVILRVARLNARDFMSAIKEEELARMRQDEVIEAHFDEYKDDNPGQYLPGSKVSEDFGFGYRHSRPRVNVLYATVRQRVVGQVVRETAAKGRSEEALEKLTEAKVDEIAKQLSGHLGRYAEFEGSPEGPIEFFKAAGIARSAERTLELKLEKVYVNEEPLHRAVDKLAAEAGGKVTAIFLPTGVESIDVTQKVTLLATDITLREALDRVIAEAAEKTRREEQSTTKPSTLPAPTTQKARPPTWQWVTFKGLDGALFPAGGDAGVESLPIDGPTETGLVGTLQLSLVFADSATATGQRIAEIAFSAKELGVEGALIEAGQLGPNLVSRGGITVWRLVEAAPPDEPKELTDELRSRIVEDLKIKRAFELACDYAGRIEEGALTGDKGLLPVTEDDTKVALFDTYPVSRRIDVLDWAQGISRREMIFRRDIYYRIIELIARNRFFVWNYVYEPSAVSVESDEYREARASIPDDAEFEQYLNIRRHAKALSLIVQVPEAHRGQVMEAVFSLAPEDARGTLPDRPIRLRVIPIARSREVLLLQAIGYEPPKRVQYGTMREALARRLESARREKAGSVWFDFESIEKRTGFVPRTE